VPQECRPARLVLLGDFADPQKVCQVLHEHETALSAPNPANRSHRLM
jgi:hypothetical protein